MSNKPSNKPFTPDELKKIIAVLSLAYFEAHRINSDYGPGDSLMELVRDARRDLEICSGMQDECADLCVDAYLKARGGDIRRILAYDAYNAMDLLGYGIKAAILALREYRYEEEEAIINSPIGD